MTPSLPPVILPDALILLDYIGIAVFAAIARGLGLPAYDR